MIAEAIWKQICQNVFCVSASNFGLSVLHFSGTELGQSFPLERSELMNWQLWTEEDILLSRWKFKSTQISDCVDVKCVRNHVGMPGLSLNWLVWVLFVVHNKSKLDSELNTCFTCQEHFTFDSELCIVLSVLLPVLALLWIPLHHTVTLCGGWWEPGAHWWVQKGKPALMPGSWWHRGVYQENKCRVGKERK